MTIKALKLMVDSMNDIELRKFLDAIARADTAAMDSVDWYNIGQIRSALGDLIEQEADATIDRLKARGWEEDMDPTGTNTAWIKSDGFGGLWALTNEDGNGPPVVGEKVALTHFADTGMDNMIDTQVFHVIDAALEHILAERIADYPEMIYWYCPYCGRKLDGPQTQVETCKETGEISAYVTKVCEGCRSDVSMTVDNPDL